MAAAVAEGGASHAAMLHQPLGHSAQRLLSSLRPGQEQEREWVGAVRAAVAEGGASHAAMLRRVLEAQREILARLDTWGTAGGQESDDLEQGMHLRRKRASTSSTESE